MTRPKRPSKKKAAPRIVPVAAVVGGGLLLLIAALSLLDGSGGAKAAIEVSGQPRLKVDKESVDLGDLRLGRTVEADFVLTNVGDQPLELTQAPYVEVVEGC